MDSLVEPMASLSFVKGAVIEVNADGMQEEKPLPHDEHEDIKLPSAYAGDGVSRASNAAAAAASSLYDQLVQNAVKRVEAEKMTSVIHEAREEDTSFFSQVEAQRQARVVHELEDRKRVADEFKEAQAKAAKAAQAAAVAAKAAALQAALKDNSSERKKDVGIVLVKRRRKL